jgi:superfamily I DNA and/or RNA helicase
LQPFSLNEKVYAKGYTLSLLERVGYIAEEMGVSEVPYKLIKQHRMVPELAELPANVFYHDMLQNGEITEDLSGNVLEKPLLFIDTEETWEIRGDDGLSYFNVKETLVAASYVDKLYLAGVNAEKIAVLAFYDGEITFAKRVFPKICEAPQEYLNGLQIQTVDASEGRDFDIVILLCVRTNRGGNRGFLRRERLLVGLTRARSRLRIVGNSAMWDTIDDDGWKDLIQHCKAKRLVTTTVE